MNQSLSCNSLTVYHYVTPSKSSIREKSAVSKSSKKSCLASGAPTSAHSEFKFRHRGLRMSERKHVRARSLSKKPVFTSQWTSRYDFVSISAPTSSQELTRRSSAASAVSVLGPTEQLVPEREMSRTDVRCQKDPVTRDLTKQLEDLKAELKQCQEAARLSENQAFVFSAELSNVRTTLNAEKDRLARQVHASSKIISDQKTTIKNLSELNDMKDCTITTLKHNLTKSEACNASRSATIKSIKEEMAVVRKDLAESSRSEEILQQCNKDLMADNKKLKAILEDMKTSITLLQQSNSEWEEIVDKQIELLTKEGENHHFGCRVITSQKLGSLKASYDHRVQLLLKKLFRADRKTKQLYHAIEKIIKGIHAHLFTGELKDLIKFDVKKYMEGGGDLPQSSIVLQLGDWMDSVHDLAHKKRFSSDLSEFIINVLDTYKKPQPR